MSDIKELKQKWVKEQPHTCLEHCYYVIHRGLLVKYPQTPESQLMRLKNSFSPVTNKRKLELGGRKAWDTLLNTLRFVYTDLNNDQETKSMAFLCAKLLIEEIRGE